MGMHVTHLASTCRYEAECMQINFSEKVCSLKSMSVFLNLESADLSGWIREHIYFGNFYSVIIRTYSHWHEFKTRTHFCCLSEIMPTRTI